MKAITTLRTGLLGASVLTTPAKPRGAPAASYPPTSGWVEGHVKGTAPIGPPNPEDAGLRVTVSGLKGGDAVKDIGTKRLNGILAAGRLLDTAVRFGGRLVDACAGDASAAKIANAFAMNIYIPGDRASEAIDALFATWSDIAKASGEKAAQMRVRFPIDEPPTALTLDATRAMAKVLTSVPDGVLASDENLPDGIKAWSNLGGWTVSHEGDWSLDYRMRADTAADLKTWSVKVDDAARAWLGVSTAQHVVTWPREAKAHRDHGSSCGCVTPLLFEVATEHRARAVASAPAPVGTGVSATLGYTFDFDAAAAGIRASLSAYVGANTSNPPGNEARVVDLITDRLAKAGIEARVTEPAPGRKNLIATLKGSGEDKPLVLMAHTDVVPADGQVWTTPPHVLTEKGGMLHGRGTRDDLVMVAANVELFLMLAAAKVPLKRDIILVCTADEEVQSGGMRDLLKTSPDLARAGLVINEGGAIVNSGSNTPALYVGYEVAQKTAQDFILTTKGQPGHSAFPIPGNAIARLGKAIGRIGDAVRPARMLEVTRAYFKARAAIEADPKLRDAMLAIANANGDPPADAVAVIDANPQLATLLRTTYAPTLFSGGIKNNVLPSSATANVNARIMPDETVDDAQAVLERIIDDDQVVVTRAAPIGSAPASPVEGPFADALRIAAATLWPNAPLLPSFAAGYTDSRFFRALGIPAYGFNPFPGTVAELLTIHAGDERIQASGLRPGIELYTKLVLQLAAKPA